ncbi:uncharacterized protein V2V93DRAFT_370429 [Kockiozyma suomiensis]|uniref:uncharacterized protein n=1 Tax=Kockiozyma suomiensis TaxID=1337062 RepID=UPI0033434ACF
MSSDGLPPMPTPAEYHEQTRPQPQSTHPRQVSHRSHEHPGQHARPQQQKPPLHQQQQHHQSQQHQQQYQPQYQQQQYPQQQYPPQQKPAQQFQQSRHPAQQSQQPYSNYQSHPQSHVNNYQDQQWRPQSQQQQQQYQAYPPQSQQRPGPPQSFQQRPPSVKPILPPPAPTPAPADSVRQIFRSVDVNNNGRLSERELRSALLNFDRSKFDPATVKLMFQMFDSDRSGTINVQEFERLWDYLSKWQERFKEFDLDHTFTISLQEFDLALKAFGYNLTPEFTKFIFQSFVKRDNDFMTFDLFVQSCVMLLHLSANFNKYGPDSSGTVRINFEQFMTEILTLR